MNAFAIEGDVSTGNIDWYRSARSLDNRRVVKMFTETKQILATALISLNADESLLPLTRSKKRPYRSFNPKCPTNIWAYESSANFASLLIHLQGLHDEYCERFSRKEIIEENIKDIKLLHNSFRIMKNKFGCHQSTSLRLVVPEEHMMDNPILSYRSAYVQKPNITYPKNKIPSWFPKMRGNIPFEII